MRHLQPWLWLYGVNFGHALFGVGCFRSNWVDFTHFWTLAIEEQFYLIWPLIVWSLSRKALMRFSLAVVMVSFAFRGHWLPISPTAQNLLAAGIGASGSLAAGAFVAMLRRNQLDPRTAAKAGRLVAVAAGILFLSIILSGHERGKVLVDTVGVLLLSVAFGGLVLALESGPSGRFFHSRILQFFGKYSYGLYVFHHLLQPIFITWDFRPWFGSYTVATIVWLGAISAVSIGCSLLSWHLFEKRILAFKRFFVYEYPLPTPAAREDLGSMSAGALSEYSPRLPGEPATSVAG